LTTRVYRATGRVVGMHNGEMGRLMVTSRGGESASQGSDLRENGEFDMNDLLPGSYKAHLMLFSFTGTKPEGKFAELSPPIEVEHDLTGLTLQIEPTVVVHGKFRMDKGSNPDWRQLNVTLNPLSESTNQEFGEMFVPPLWSPVSSDGSFELRDAQTERYQVVIGSSSSSLRDYFTKAVEVNGHDMIDSGFEIQSGISLDIIVSANGATIEGIVTNKKGNPVPGAAVVSIPSAEHHLRRDLYEQEKTNANGHFSLRGLSPGEYSILAFEDLDEDFRQPNFLKSYEGISEKVQVGEGDNKSIDLKLIPAQSGTDK
jgi:Carboxypeptidase regulatory-like domain